MIKLSDHLYIPPMGQVLADRKKQVPHKRFAAASGPSRLNVGWTMQPESINWTIRMGTRILRARAREFAHDNHHAKKYLRMVRSNVIGQNGIQLQCRARLADDTLNADLNKRVEKVFYKWTMPETCSLSGKLDWLAAQRLFVTQLARDGEVLVRKVQDANNPFGFSLKFIDVSYLDEGYNMWLPNGNRVLMSVEYDPLDRPVAYWLTTPQTELTFVSNPRVQPVRVPADEIIHAFDIGDDESQVRGITWFHAVLLQGKSLQAYVEGVVTQARMTAMSLGFIEEEVPDETDWQGEDGEDGRPVDPQIDFRPGSFTRLNPGQKITQWDPKQPTQNHAEFKRSMEHDVAAGLDINYFEMTGDMASVNLSTARIGINETRDNWRDIQDFVATKFCRAVFHAWLPCALLSGQLEVTPAEYEQLFNPYWRGRGWQYMDPLKEVEANVAALENNLATWTEIHAEQGRDLVDYLEERKAEIELAAKYNIDLTAVTSVKVAETTDPQDPNSTAPADAADAQDTADQTPQRGFTNGHAELLN